MFHNGIHRRISLAPRGLVSRTRDYCDRGAPRNSVSLGRGIGSALPPLPLGLIPPEFGISHATTLLRMSSLVGRRSVVPRVRCPPSAQGRATQGACAEFAYGTCNLHCTGTALLSLFARGGKPPKTPKQASRRADMMWNLPQGSDNDARNRVKQGLAERSGAMPSDPYSKINRTLDALRRSPVAREHCRCPCGAQGSQCLCDRAGPNGRLTIRGMLLLRHYSMQTTPLASFGDVGG